MTLRLSTGHDVAGSKKKTVGVDTGLASWSQLANVLADASRSLVRLVSMLTMVYKPLHYTASFSPQRVIGPHRFLIPRKVRRPGEQSS